MTFNIERFDSYCCLVPRTLCVALNTKKDLNVEIVKKARKAFIGITILFILVFGFLGVLGNFIMFSRKYKNYVIILIYNSATFTE